MLYCALTGQLMDKSLAAVKKHMQGKKFLRAQGEAAHMVIKCFDGLCIASSGDLGIHVL
jgi:hypothetical protein